MTQSQSQTDLKVPTENSIVVVPFIVALPGSELKLAINVHKIVKVIDVENMAPLPPEYEPFTGVLDVDDTPVPIFDLRHFFNRTRTEAATDESQPLTHETRRIIICHLQGLFVGMIVDRTRKLEQYANEQVLPVPGGLAGHKTPYFSALIKDQQTEGRYTYLLDIEAILAGFQVMGDGAAKESTHGKPDGWLKNRRILIVEDSRLFQKKCLQLFKRLGATCDLASNGKEGLQMLQDNHYNYDLIFSDIEMPIMNGIQMVAEIQKRSPRKVPVLFNSALSNGALIDELQAKGWGQYIIKFDEDMIVRKLSEMFGAATA